MLRLTKLLFLLALTFNVLSLSAHQVAKGPQTKSVCPDGTFQLSIPKGDGVHDHVYYIVARSVPDNDSYQWVDYLKGQDTSKMGCWKQTFLNGRKAIKMDQNEAYLMPYDQVKENNWQWATVGGLKWLNQSPYTSTDITFQACSTQSYYRVVATFRGVFKAYLVGYPDNSAYFADQKYIDAGNLSKFTCFYKK